MTNRQGEQAVFLRDIDALGVLGAIDQPARKDLTLAADYLELSANDCLTVRDLAEFAHRPNDPALAFVLLLLFGALDQGSLCLDLDHEALAAPLPVHLKDSSRAYAAEFTANLASGRYADIIGSGSGDNLPLVVDRDKGRTLLYFQKFHAHEQRLKTRVEALLSSRNFLVDEARMEAIIDGLYELDLAIRVGREQTPVKKDEVQLDALRLSLRHPFAIISGGPGTGKTSLMVTLLRALVRAGIDPSQIILGAPTGRAAQRMTEAVRAHLASVKAPTSEDVAIRDLQGGTLHKILIYNGRTHDFVHKASNPLQAAVIVLDEVSMVDLVMLETFLQAVDPDKTRLIFLGDKDQLPSVEAGSVFADMIPDGTRGQTFRDRLVVLENVYRSGIGLLKLARAINRGEMPDLTTLSMAEALVMAPDQCVRVPFDHPEQILSAVRAWAGHYYLTPQPGKTISYCEAVRACIELDDPLDSDPGKDLIGQLFGMIEAARILTLVRNGSQGCTGINALVGACLCRELDPRALAGDGCYAGEMIIITRNDYSKDLFNGDVGIVLKDGAGLYQAVFKRFDTFIRFPVDQLPSWEPAFAMTVHKSQGSEFDDVFLVLPQDPDHRMLSREIVYTGMTRARQRVIVCGTTQALSNALSRCIDRQSGLHW